MRLVTFLLVTVAALNGLCAPANASLTAASSDLVVYKNTAHDPSGDQVDPAVDILRTTRAVSRTDGARFLRIAVLARQSYAKSLGSGLRVESRLDTWGGPRGDYQLVLNLGDSGSDIPSGCSLLKRDSRVVTSAHLKLRNSGAIACRVPMAELRVTHRVHWWLLAYDYEGETADYTGLTDRAPDAGWVR